MQASHQSFFGVLWTQTVTRLACRKRILKNAVKALDIFEKLKNRGKTRKDTEKSFVGSYSNTYAKLVQASNESFYCVLWTQTVSQLACRKRILKNAVKALDIFEKLKNRGKTRKDTEKSFVGSYSNTYAKLVQASYESFYCVLWTQTVSQLACRKRILKNAVKALDIFEKLKNRGKTRKDREVFCG